MSFKSDREKEQRASNKEQLWGGIFFGVLFLFLGLRLVLNTHLKSFITQVNDRFSSTVHEVLVTPKSSAIACFIAAFFCFLLAYGAFARLKKDKLSKND